ncbi:MAG TPA: hypothetical protein PK095_18265, partial [Myxococcota bacterium]|nr:hypothetical protein [Myxococcota bacterium]
LLTDTTGARAPTAVVGFTCAAGPGQSTWLWMDRLVITCEGGGPFIVDVADGPGNLDPLFDEPTLDLLFQAAVYRGTGYEGGAETAWWNVALGLNTAAFAALGDCLLTGSASATDGPLEDGVTPDGVRYPLVQWSVPLIEDGLRVCTTHALDSGDEVRTVYSAASGHGFHAGFEQSSGLVTVTGVSPDATSSLTCDDLELALGDSTRCILVARQAGDPIGTASGNFQVSASAGTVSALSPAFGTSFTFQYTATTSGLVVIDSGVGPTVTLTVYELPDAAALNCATTTLAIDTATPCTLVPLKAGNPITARASDLAVSASAGTTSALSPSIGTSFTFTYTAPATSLLTTLSSPTALFGDLGFTITATPDTTSSVACSPASITTSATTTCTITPRRAGAVVYTASTSFSASTSAGSVSAVTPTGIAT